MINCSFEDGGKGKLRHVVVNALVIKNNRLLLERRAKKLEEGGKWGLAGGFIERDEVIKKAIEREVFEETGYRIKNIKLFRIIDNPKRRNEDRQNVAFVFVCEAGEKEGSQDWESVDIKWFELDKLPSEKETAFDHFQTIQLYVKHKNRKNPLLIFE